MLDQPAREGVARRHAVADPSLEAQPHRAEQPSHGADAHLGSTVALAVVLLAVLFADALDGLDVASDGLERSGDQCHEGSLIVALQEELDVAEPCHVTGHEVHHVVVLIGALAGHHVGEDVLGLVAADDEALDHGPRFPVLQEFGLAVVAVAVAEFLKLLEAAGRDVPVVDADAGHSVLTFTV